MLIGDEPLTPAAVAALARRGPATVELSAAARERIAAGHAAVVAVAARRPVYGRTTGGLEVETPETFIGVTVEKI